MIQFSPPDIREEDIREVVDTLKSGWITTGPKTALFEDRLAEFIGTEKVICCSSCTFGMEVILRLLGIGPGDEVIVPAYTYTASAAVINHVGAKIVFCDTGKESFWFDYDQLSVLITEKTKAVIAVDLGGGICDYERIFQIIDEKKALFRANSELQKKFDRVIVVADGAHSLGAKRIFNGSWSNAGTIADFTAFSFHAVKNLTTAEGGAVTWRTCPEIDSNEMYRFLKTFILHGQTKDAFTKASDNGWEYDIIQPAYKGNMTDIMASMGISQMNRIGEILNRRRFIIESYQKGLESPVTLWNESYTENMISSGHLFLLRIVGFHEKNRNQLIQKLLEAGINTNVHYKPLPMMTAYKKMGFDISAYPNAYHQYENEITLPVHMLLSDEDVDYIIRTVKRIIC